MIISIEKPSWKNEDDERYIEIEIRWPKRAPRGWAYIEEKHVRQLERLIENAAAGKEPINAYIGMKTLLRRAVSRMPR